MYRKSAHDMVQATTQATNLKENLILTKEDRNILKAVQHNPDFTQKEIAVKLGWTLDRVKYYLNKMKKLGIIKRVGSSQKGYWEVLIKNNGKRITEV